VEKLGVEGKKTRKKGKWERGEIKARGVSKGGVERVKSWGHLRLSRLEHSEWQRWGKGVRTNERKEKNRGKKLETLDPLFQQTSSTDQKEH